MKKENRSVIVSLRLFPSEAEILLRGAEEFGLDMNNFIRVILKKSNYRLETRESEEVYRGMEAAEIRPVGSNDRVRLRKHAAG